MPPADSPATAQASTPSETEALCTPLRQLAAEAGALILKHYRRLAKVAVSAKADDSPLTEADLASHHLIEDGLAQLAPQWPILSEESQQVDLAQLGRERRYWLVDPLDGTREFLKASGDFTVNIALIEDGRPALGVIYVPVRQECYWAWHGGGAWMEEDGGEARRLHARAWSGGELAVVVSRSHSSPKVARWLEALPWTCKTVPLGSSLKFCILARGDADVYPRFGATSLWDIGAAECILAEAGGNIIDFDGAELAYNPAENILNPHFIARADPALPADVALSAAQRVIA